MLIKLTITDSFAALILPLNHFVPHNFILLEFSEVGSSYTPSNIKISAENSEAHFIVLQIGSIVSTRLNPCNSYCNNPRDKSAIFSFDCAKCRGKVQQKRTEKPAVNGSNFSQEIPYILNCHLDTLMQAKAQE